MMSARSRFGKHLGILALLLVVMSMPRPARAGENTWTPFGPSDAALQSLTASPHGELYVTASFGVTEIWQLPQLTVPWLWRNNGLGLPSVTALAVDPKNSNSLWAASGDAGQRIFHSTDAGGSWTPVSNVDANFQVAHLWVAPTRKSVVLLAEISDGQTRRLLRSADGGVSWTDVPGARGPIAAPPDEPNVVFAASMDGLGVVRSLDGGLTFHPTGRLPIQSDLLRALHATYGRGASLFVSFLNGGLFRSTDMGGHWSRVGFLNAGPATLASEPKVPSTIYAGNLFGLYVSQKNGKNGSFRPLSLISPPQAIPEPAELAAAPGGPYFLSGPDLYRYNPANFGSLELVAKTGIESFGVAELRFHPADPSLLAVRQYTRCSNDTCDFRTLLSSDGGKTFQRLGTQLSPRIFADVFALAFDPVSTQRWLMAMGVGAVLTENGASRVVLPGPVATVEIAAGGVLLVGGVNGVQASADDGATWQTTLDNAGGTRQIVDLVVNPFAPERVVARAVETASGNPNPAVQAIYHSSDAGHTWTKILDGSGDVAFIPGAPASLYLLESTATGTDLRRSDDDGATSQLIHSFTRNEVVSDLAIDPSAPGVLYVASMSGILRSRDGGATWLVVGDGFNPWGPYRIGLDLVKVHPTERGHLFAGSVYGGLFENRSTN